MANDGTLKSLTKQVSDDDRVKIIDHPDFLVVSPKTHAASVKYGMGTSWCTAVGDDTAFRQYTNQGYLFYFIFYQTMATGKRIGERNKMALWQNKRTNKNEWYDSSDQRIPESAIDLIIQKNVIETIQNYIDELKKSTDQFNVGDMVRVNDTYEIKLTGNDFDVKIFYTVPLRCFTGEIVQKSEGRFKMKLIHTSFMAIDQIRLNGDTKSIISRLLAQQTQPIYINVVTENKNITKL